MAHIYDQWAGNPAGTPEDPARCVEAVRDPNGWHRYQCRNKRTHGEFCKTHSPEAKAARKAKQTARYERQSLEFDINAARRPPPSRRHRPQSLPPTGLLRRPRARRRHPPIPIGQAQMTLLRILSDLHLEFGPLPLAPIGEDILVLAGDIGLHTQGALRAKDYAQTHQIPTIMIAGNHEFYRQRGDPRPYTISSTYRDLSDLSEEPYFYFLQDDIQEVLDITFIGTTLWTDFKLNGDAPLAMLRARQSMNDYRLIHDGDLVTPQQILARHEFSAGLLRERLPRKYHDGSPVVVITHHLPSARSIAGRYANNDLNSAYASNLDALVAASEAALWIHGHTHVSQDYHINNTRVICNPRGYDGYELNPDFNPNLLIEV